MRTIPNMIVSAPMDEVELRNMMYTVQLPENKHPVSIRYPRGCGIIPDWKRMFEKIPVGKGRQLTQGEELAILTIGKSGIFAQDAVKQLADENIYVSHYDMRFVKPLDEELLKTIFSKYPKIMTIEDGAVRGGFGSAVLEFMAEIGFSVQVKLLGIPDRFIEHGSLEELYEACGINTEGIVREARKLLVK
jgi:1-deoxy-D-xylulose-5-phosphate synthase